MRSTVALVSLLIRAKHEFRSTNSSFAKHESSGFEFRSCGARWLDYGFMVGSCVGFKSCEARLLGFSGFSCLKHGGLSIGL